MKNNKWCYEHMHIHTKHIKERQKWKVLIKRENVHRAAHKQKVWEAIFAA